AVALGSRGVALAGVEHDVMLAAYLLDPGHGSHSLEELAMAYQGRVLQGDVAAGEARGRRGGDDAAGLHAVFAAPAGQGQAEAAAASVAERLELIWALAPRLEGFLAEDGLAEVYRRIELPLWPVLAEMELAGVRIDTDALRRLGQQLAEEIQRAAEEIFRLAGERFNINSPRQLSRILFEKLKLPVVKQTKTGPSTSADVLEELAGEHEVVVRILDYRQLVKLKGTYVDPIPALVNPRTGRLHTTFHQAVTATGRLSSSNPNLQNIPVRTDQGAVIREAFVAGAPDWRLMSADYSQIELRVLAHMSQDPALIEAFRLGQDIHTRTASEVFGVPMEAVTPQMRSGAKAINFGIVYGISAYGLARGTGLTREQAQAFIDSYFQRYPGVKAYLDRTVRQAREQGYVTTLFGRRRYLPEIYSRQRAQKAFAERMAMNTPIQGTAADIMKMAMVAVHRRLKEDGWQARMVLQVHDELLLELPQAEVDPVGSMVKQAMEGVVELAVPLVAEVKAGRNWRECK
ncbi:MAG TPA: DNA polymerase I, partial [Limnochordales bacterium]